MPVTIAVFSQGGVQVTSSLSAARHQKSSYPLDYTGVVEGVEIQERRSRYHAREGAEEAARQPTQNPQAFGEQLSQALHALQTSSPESAAVAAGALEVPLISKIIRPLNSGHVSSHSRAGPGVMPYLAAGLKLSTPVVSGICYRAALGGIHPMLGSVCCSSSIRLRVWQVHCFPLAVSLQKSGRQFM